MQNLDPKYVSFEMDVFWMKQPGQDPVALMKKYSGRFKLLHLKDRNPVRPTVSMAVQMRNQMWCLEQAM